MTLKVIVAGMGVQGAKRQCAAGDNVVATVDPVAEGVDYKDVRNVPLDDFDAAILCIPLFDTFRVIAIRLLNKKSPFDPDRNHMHHVLIDNGLSHFNASIFLAISNYVIALILIYGSSLFNSYIMLVVLILVYALFLLLFYKLKQIALIKDRVNIGATKEIN